VADGELNVMQSDKWIDCNIEKPASCDLIVVRGTHPEKEALCFYHGGTDTFMNEDGCIMGVTHWKYDEARVSIQNACIKEYLECFGLDELVEMVMDKLTAEERKEILNEIRAECEAERNYPW